MITGTREFITIVLSSPSADAAAALEVFEWVIRHAATIVGVTAQCDSDNPPTGSAAQIDINNNGSTILSTKLTIDASESDSKTAATAAVLSSSTLAVDDVLTFDIDQVGSTNPGIGYAVTLEIIRSL